MSFIGNLKGCARIFDYLITDVFRSHSELIVKSQISGILGMTPVYLLKMTNFNPLAGGLSLVAARVCAGATNKFLALTFRFDSSLPQHKHLLDITYGTSAVANYCVALKFVATLSTPALIGLNAAVGVCALACIMAKAKEKQKQEQAKLNRTQTA